MKRLIKFEPGMRALDIGAGLGKCMRSLTNAGFDAYGIEPSEPFYNKAIREMGADPERLELATLEGTHPFTCTNLPFARSKRTAPASATHSRITTMTSVK